MFLRSFNVFWYILNWDVVWASSWTFTGWILLKTVFKLEKHSRELYKLEKHWWELYKMEKKFYVVIAFTFCSSLIASAKVYILWMCHCGCLKLYSISIMDIGKHNDKMHYAVVCQRAMQYHTTQCNTMQYPGIKWNIIN